MEAQNKICYEVGAFHNWFKHTKTHGANLASSIAKAKLLDTCTVISVLNFAPMEMPQNQKHLYTKKLVAW